MKKNILFGILVLFIPALLLAQKHAPTLNSQKVTYGIYPEGSTRFLRASDVEGLSSWDLKIMRNEIFARRGYIFKTEDMINYFSEQSWYKPRFSKVENLFSSIEKRNIEFIKKYE